MSLPISEINEMAKTKQRLERKNTPDEDFSDGVGIRFPDINALDDVCDAIDICEEYQIPYDGLDDLDDFKERIKLHLRKTRKLQSRKTEIENSIIKAGKDDVNKRWKLKSVMTDLIEILQTHSGHADTQRRGSILVEGLLRTEGTSNDLVKDCQIKAEEMSHGECLLLVAGETSSGKSSVLNLLFEDDVLPVHTKSSTSVIIIVRYANKAYARIVYKTKEPERTFDLDDDGMKELHAVAFMEDADERESHNIKAVQVYLPLTVLKSGLVLVDTPGIGENEFLESELMNFINENTIHGCMYIIKTDNAGGVQEDRLLNLLKLVINKHRSDSSDNPAMRFDPKSALFVCNRFDLIAKSAEDQVRANAFKKLSECWPNFSEHQVIFFSAEKAKRDFEVDPDYINNNYKMLLEAVRDFFITVTETRIQVAYKWIENILKRTVHHLKSVVKRLDYSDMDLNEKSDSTRQKLNTLKKRSDYVIESLECKLKEKANTLCKTLRKNVSQEAVKAKLTTNWHTEDLPSIDKGLGDWDWVKQKIYERFYDKLCTSITAWDTPQQVIDIIETEMSKEIKLELNLLQEELYQIEKEMQEESSLHGSLKGGSIRRSRNIGTSADFSQLSPLSPLGRSNVSITKLKLPTRLAGRLLSPVKTMITNIRHKNRLDNFRNDPVKVAEEKAKEIYAELLSQADTDGSGFMPVVEYLLERPREYINKLKQKIPYFILSNQMQLNMIQQSIATERMNQAEYERMMTDVEKLRRNLNEYGEGCIFVNDFMRNEIQIQWYNAEGEAISMAFNVTDFIRSDNKVADIVRRPDIHGLWTVTYRGSLVRNNQEIPISIRCYLPSSKVETTFQEVAKLRCLTARGEHIAGFLGTHHTETRTPAFIYSGALKSVRRFLQSFCNKRECVPQILEGTILGLQYLHKKGLVHMELSQDTVTVDENGDVQLTGACLPRFASLPSDIESMDTGNFIYLAPEVLRGQKYDACADIYSFGLFLVELAVHEARGCVFRNERKMTLCDFIRDVDPESMLKLEDMLQNLTLKTRALIQNCLAVKKVERPPMDDVVEYTLLVKTEKEALEKLPTRHSRGHVIRRNPKDTK